MVLQIYKPRGDISFFRCAIWKHLIKLLSFCVKYNCNPLSFEKLINLALALLGPALVWLRLAFALNVKLQIFQFGWNNLVTRLYLFWPNKSVLNSLFSLFFCSFINRKQVWIFNIVQPPTLAYNCLTFQYSRRLLEGA